MAELATIARPYAEALCQSTKPAEFAASLEQLNELAQLAALPEVARNPPSPKSTGGVPPTRVGWSFVFGTPMLS